VLKPVATIDAKYLCYGSKTMGRVEVSCVIFTPVEAPHALVTGFFIELQPAQVMDVCTFGVHKLSKYPIPGHI